MTAEQLDPMLATRTELAGDFAEGILLDCEDNGEVELLERDEIAAIHLYTQNGKFSAYLSELLRSRARQMLKPFAPYLKLLLGALFKLPRVKGTVYRGIMRNVSASYKSGSKFVWWAVSSTTLSIDSLSRDAHFANSSERTYFSIAAQHAIDISRYSSVPSESELILVPGTRLRVVACLPSGPGLCIVQCEEIGSPLGFFEFTEMPQQSVQVTKQQPLILPITTISTGESAASTQIINISKGMHVFMKNFCHWIFYLLCHCLPHLR